jgi:hypothetical protein
LVIALISASSAGAAYGSVSAHAVPDFLAVTASPLAVVSLISSILSPVTSNILSVFLPASGLSGRFQVTK